jgi:hypothetical protein
MGLTVADSAQKAKPNDTISGLANAHLCLVAYAARQLDRQS